MHLAIESANFRRPESLNATQLDDLSATISFFEVIDTPLVGIFLCLSVRCDWTDCDEAQLRCGEAAQGPAMSGSHRPPRRKRAFTRARWRRVSFARAPPLVESRTPSFEHRAALGFELRVLWEVRAVTRGEGRGERRGEERRAEQSRAEQSRGEGRRGEPTAILDLAPDRLPLKTAPAARPAAGYCRLADCPLSNKESGGSPGPPLFRRCPVPPLCR